MSDQAHSKDQDTRPLWIKPAITELSPDDPRCVELAAKLERQKAAEST